LSGRGLCDELITRPEESYRPCCVVVCDLETSRMGAPYIYDISRLRVNPCHRKSTECLINDLEMQQTGDAGTCWSARASSWMGVVVFVLLL